MHTQRGDSVATGAQGEDGEPTPAEEQQARPDHPAGAGDDGVLLDHRAHPLGHGPGRGRPSWRQRSATPAASRRHWTSSSRGTTGWSSTSPARPPTATTRRDRRRDPGSARRHRAPGVGPRLPHPPGRQDRRQPTVPLETRDDMSMAYTPASGASHGHRRAPEDVAAPLTVKGNAVAVVTDGSAVLGLGNLGPRAALPVMEGKAALFKRFANIDAWPICLDTQDPTRSSARSSGISPGFGGHQPRGHRGAPVLRGRGPAASSSTSRCSTTTSTARRSSCSPP